MKTSDCIKELLKMARPIWWSVVAACLPGIVKIASSLCFVWASKEMVDIATGSSQRAMTPVLALLVLSIIISIAANIGGKWWEDYFSTVTRNKMRLDLFRHALTSKWNGRETFHSADTVNRLEEDVRMISEHLCIKLPEVIVTLLQLAAACAFLFIMQSSLLWILLIIMPVAVIGSRMFFRLVREITSKLRNLDSDTQKLMQESLESRLVILTLGCAERIVSKMESTQEDVRRHTIKRLNLNATSRSFMAVGFRAGYLAAFLWGVFGIEDGTVTYGMMTAFLQLVGQVQMPIANLAQHIPSFIHVLSSVERLAEINGLRVTDPGKSVIFEKAPGIKMENLAFRYDEGMPYVIDNLTFDITPGAICAITGETGAGKSTLTKLILGLLQPGEGTIQLYGGDTVAKASQDCLGNFIYVPQGNTLISGTIRENLLMAGENATDSQIEEALRTAAAEFVFDLPDGVDTVCSEKGAGLSEGQAQRIAIARALLHGGSVVILDEATSALDSDTEKRLMDNITKRFGGQKTIIMVTHRENVANSATLHLHLNNCFYEIH